MSVPLLAVCPEVCHYDWGKLCVFSRVATLLSSYCWVCLSKHRDCAAVNKEPWKGGEHGLATSLVSCVFLHEVDKSKTQTGQHTEDCHVSNTKAAIFLALQLVTTQDTTWQVVPSCFHDMTRCGSTRKCAPLKVLEMLMTQGTTRYDM